MIIGAVLIAIGVVVVLPVLFWAGLLAASWAASIVLPAHAEATHQGSELLETNI